MPRMSVQQPLEQTLQQALALVEQLLHEPSSKCDSQLPPCSSISTPQVLANQDVQVKRTQAPLDAGQVQAPEPLKTCLKPSTSVPIAGSLSWTPKPSNHVQICEPAFTSTPAASAACTVEKAKDQHHEDATTTPASPVSKPSLGFIPKLTKSLSHRISSTVHTALEAQPAASATQLFSSPGKSALGVQHAGLKLWEGNKSKAEIPRLGVRVIQAQIYDHDDSSAQVWDPFASVKCEKTRHLTRTMPKTTDPEWDEYFVFEVKSPAFAVLRIKVYDKIRCWRPSLVGEVRIQVKSISDMPGKYSQPTWQTLHSRKNKEPRGRVQIQLYYMSMRLHRPLNVMCCTWNVGNAPPPEDLGTWLKGVNTLEHDIVAIGVQECTYRVKEHHKQSEHEWTTLEPSASFVARGNHSGSSSRHGSFSRDILLSTSNKPPSQGRGLRHSAHTTLDTMLFSDEIIVKQSAASAVMLTGRRRSWVTDDARNLSVVHQGGAESSGSSWLQITRGSGSARLNTMDTQQRSATTGGMATGPIAEGLYRPEPIPVAEGLYRADSVNSVAGPGDEPLPLALGSIEGQLPARLYTARRTETDTARGIKDVWEDRLKEALGPQYWMVRGAHMGQMRLVVFARNDIVPGVSNVCKGSQATGVAGVATNKGAVAIALQVWDTELCFINSHLAAHQDKSAARNMNYRDIVRGLRLDPHHMDILTAYHHVFWMGDLNYRLDYGQQALNPTPSPCLSDFIALQVDIDNKKWPELLAMCQLRREMRNRRAFLGFSEAEINFPPSFKVQRQGGMYYKSQRSPAWCDRVLYRSNLPMKQVRPLDYFIVPDVGTSDHKPVGAIFSVPTIWKQDDDGQQGVGIALMITHLAARGLFMLRTASGAGSVSALPSTQITLMGPCMKADDWKSGVAKASRNPVWVGRGPFNSGAPALIPAVTPGQPSIMMEDLAPSEPVTTTPLKLALKTAALQDLSNRRLLVRVVQVAEGKVVGSGHHTIARAVLPLYAPAMQLVQSKSPGDVTSCSFTVPMEYNGLPAGWLDVECSLEVVNVAVGSYKANSNRMSSTASSILQTLSTTLFSRLKSDHA